MVGSGDEDFYQPSKRSADHSEIEGHPHRKRQHTEDRQPGYISADGREAEAIQAEERRRAARMFEIEERQRQLEFGQATKASDRHFKERVRRAEMEADEHRAQAERAAKEARERQVQAKLSAAKEARQKEEEKKRAAREAELRKQAMRGIARDREMRDTDDSGNEEDRRDKQGQPGRDADGSKKAHVQRAPRARSGAGPDGAGTKDQAS